MESNAQTRKPYRRGAARREILKRAIEIRRMFADSDLTQAEVAEQFGVSAAHANRIINQKSCESPEK